MSAHRNVKWYGGMTDIDIAVGCERGKYVFAVSIQGSTRKAPVPEKNVRSLLFYVLARVDTGVNKKRIIVYEIRKRFFQEFFVLGRYTFAIGIECGKSALFEP